MYPAEAATVSKIELENACMRDKGTKDKRDGGRKIDGGIEIRTKIFRPRRRQRYQHMGRNVAREKRKYGPREKECIRKKWRKG